jgi:hypothetical protein
MNNAQELTRRIYSLENSVLAKTRNMQHFNAKVKLYQEIKELKEELKSLGGGVNV